MAKLQKLSIGGIRSFGPNVEHIQQIKFNDSVTLFLGQNGCGKTTILEAIKFALSSELPAGCGSGQGFVNDPTISGRAETKGQVRLKITDVNGKEIIIVKSVQVSKQKGGALRFKSLDSAINEVVNGQKKQFSGRCVDIDSYCAEALQVSSCILNNVLLCHQENSAWPLEEGKKLKEKFDEIFESTRYNKCVDLLRKKYKDDKDRLKTLKIELDYKKENKERVEKMKIKLQDKKNDLESKERSIIQKQSELTPLETRLQEIRALEENFGKIEKSLASKEATKKGIVEQQNAIKKNISTEFSGTDEELKEKIDSFQKERENDEKKISQMERKKVEIENKQKEISSKIQSLHGQMGQLKEEKRQFDNQLIERRSLIEKGKIYLKVGSESGSYDTDDDAEAVIDILKNAIDKQKESLENKQMEKAADEAILQNTIDEIKEKHISIKQQIENKNLNLKECEKKIKEITNDLHDLKVSGSQLDIINNKIEDIDKDIASLRRSFDENEIANQIEQGKSQISTMERQKTQLEQEYRLLQKNSVLLEKMENAREAIVQKQTEINKLKSKHSDNLEKLFGQCGNIPSPLKPAVKSLLEKEEQNLKKLQTKLNEKQKEVTTLDARLLNQNEKIKTHESDFQNKKKQIQDVCKGESFDEVLNKVTARRESLQKDKAVCSSLKVFYENFISKFQQENPCCPVCKTNFQNKRSLVQQIIADLKKEIESVPRNLPKLELELKKTEQNYNKLQQLKPTNDNIHILSEVTLPSLQEELDEMRMSLASANNELSSIAKEMEIPQQKIEVCKNLITDAAFLDQYQIDIQKSEAVVKDVESQVIRSSSNKSIQEIEAEIDTLSFDIADLRKKVDTDKMKLDRHKSRLQDLRENKSKLVEKQLDYQRAVQGRPEKEKQLAEHEEKVELLKVEIKELTEKLLAIRNDLSEAQKKKEEMVKSNAKIIDELRNKLDSNKKILEDIDRLHTSITRYIQANKTDAISSIENELAQFKKVEEALENTRGKLLEAISDKKGALAKQETLFRELNDNVSLREKQKQEQAINAEIEELKRQIGSHNLTSVHNEKRTLLQQYEVITREINVMTGQQHQLKNEMAELESDLRKPSNKNAFEDYRDKLYEMTVVTLANQDLEKYINILEKSILEFHKDKMKQINKSIRELWRNIYRGNDIDYIEIKTEDATGTVKRRSYNYKVVQVKRGVELEMRGRCSAGQKVLACLVIRMALAEIFSSKCGILALDEPTTNLDRENIGSLSDSLSRLVLDRQEQTNFQLLIITHDEDFLDTLTRVQSVTSYYRVKRDEQGFSVVTKEHL